MEDLWYFLLRNAGSVLFLIKEWKSCGISYWEKGMEELWYFLIRNGGAVVFLIKEWRRCGVSLELSEVRTTLIRETERHP